MAPDLTVAASATVRGMPDSTVIVETHKRLQLTIVELRRQRDQIHAQLAELVEEESRWQRAAKIVDPDYEPLSIVVHKGEELSDFEKWLAEQPEIDDDEELEDFHHAGIGMDFQRPVTDGELSTTARKFLSEAADDADDPA